MVVEESHRSYERNDSTKATPWPQAFDVKTDLFYPGKAAEFQRQLISALRTRKLLDVLEERPVRMADLHAANPSASASDVLVAFQELQIKRLDTLATVADNLPQTIKLSALTLQEQQRFNEFVANGAGSV